MNTAELRVPSQVELICTYVRSGSSPQVSDRILREYVRRGLLTRRLQ